ncbi:MAG: short-chain dehydrogenase [Actinomycetia bacterium]|nr:short-chain dehydrogenase [Actinomycetes bacterium]
MSPGCAASGPNLLTPGVRVTSHACDVCDEVQVLRFRDELPDGHASDHAGLVFSNAGTGGGRSFISDSRQERGRTFAVDWRGVYYRARAFLPPVPGSALLSVSDVSADPDLWGFCGDAAAQEAMVLDGAGADDHGLLPNPRPPRTGRLRLARQPLRPRHSGGHHW